MKLKVANILLLLTLFAASVTQAQIPGSGGYGIGTPTVVTLYVDPAGGNDTNPGTSRTNAFRTISAAWETIPRGTTLSVGYKILLLPGEYPESSIPNYWESRYGTAQFPIIIQAESQRVGRQASTVKLLGDINMFDTRYFYLLDVDIVPNPAGDTFHCEQCRYLLLKRVHFDGGVQIAQETVKINQSQYVFIEDCDIGGAFDNAIDFVGVQYGHILNSRVHDAADWCIYAKGGSAQILLEGNEIFDCGTGGFTAGQGSGFEFMTSPWIHYEAYDIKFVNNVIHDTEGAGIGVNGGYNILLAFNTMYRVGSRSHGIEVVFGLRSCDGDTPNCASRLAAGGWGLTAGADLPIPNRNVQIIKNVLYNPTGFRSQFQHFAIHGPRVPDTGTNVPNPARTDVNLSIRGNVVWNGPSDLILGIEGASQGCQAGNATCNSSQLITDNLINVLEPQFIDAAAGDFRPLGGGNLNFLSTTVQAHVPVNFAGGDRESNPQAPLGELTNSITTDRGGSSRGLGQIPGAYAASDSPLNPTTPPGTGTPPGTSTPGPTATPTIPGVGGTPVPDTTAPAIEELTAKVTKSKKQKSVRISGLFTDNIGLTGVTATVKQGRKTVITGNLAAEGGSSYSKTLSLKKLGKTVKKITVSVVALDNAGNSTTRTVSVRVR